MKGIRRSQYKTFRRYRKNSNPTKPFSYPPTKYYMCPFYSTSTHTLCSLFQNSLANKSKAFFSKNPRCSLPLCIQLSASGSIHKPPQRTPTLYFLYGSDSFTFLPSDGFDASNLFPARSDDGQRLLCGNRWTSDTGTVANCSESTGDSDSMGDRDGMSSSIQRFPTAITEYVDMQLGLNYRKDRLGVVSVWRY